MSSRGPPGLPSKPIDVAGGGWAGGMATACRPCDGMSAPCRRWMTRRSRRSRAIMCYPLRPGRVGMGGTARPGCDRAHLRGSASPKLAPARIYPHRGLAEAPPRLGAQRPMLDAQGHEMLGPVEVLQAAG